jgi:hypothetical protein
VRLFIERVSAMRAKAEVTRNAPRRPQIKEWRRSLAAVETLTAMVNIDGRQGAQYHRDDAQEKEKSLVESFRATPGMNKTRPGKPRM